jgi:hypothetical protein
MPITKRARIAPTDDWQQLELLVEGRTDDPADVAADRSECVRGKEIALPDELGQQGAARRAGDQSNGGDDKRCGVGGPQWRLGAGEGEREQQRPRREIGQQ